MCQRYQFAEHVSVDADRMMKTACRFTGLPFRMERHNFAATVKKNPMKSPLSSVGLLIIVQKINAKVSSNCILLTVYCKGTRIYSIQRFRMKKAKFFALEMSS